MKEAEGLQTEKQALQERLSKLPPIAPQDISPERLAKIGEQWRPYRSVACWYLWASLDNAAD